MTPKDLGAIKPLDLGAIKPLDVVLDRLGQFEWTSLEFGRAPLPPLDDFPLGGLDDGPDDDVELR
jgi:hypothetical protein